MAHTYKLVTCWVCGGKGCAACNGKGDLLVKVVATEPVPEVPVRRRISGHELPNCNGGYGHGCIPGSDEQD